MKSGNAIPLLLFVASSFFLGVDFEFEIVTEFGVGLGLGVVVLFLARADICLVVYATEVVMPI